MLSRKGCEIKLAEKYKFMPVTGLDSAYTYKRDVWKINYYSPPAKFRTKYEHLSAFMKTIKYTVDCRECYTAGSKTNFFSWDRSFFPIIHEIKIRWKFYFATRDVTYLLVLFLVLPWTHLFCFLLTEFTELVNFEFNACNYVISTFYTKHGIK